MAWEGNLWVKLNRPLTDEEKRRQLRQDVPASETPRDNFSVFSMNSVFLESTNTRVFKPTASSSRRHLTAKPRWFERFTNGTFGANWHELLHAVRTRKILTALELPEADSLDLPTSSYELLGKGKIQGSVGTVYRY
ncbi:hypothetical protein PQR46_39155 [Paraburkholderia sediminicola]|uniref:hypothetical protein n=1 Tax=Paraburkholderia sediminicola TaxID=458836 RepID=UPI0038BD6D9A